MDSCMTKQMDRITIPERVLLHLLDHFQLSEEYTRPLELTQEGIALCVDVKRSHSAKVMRLSFPFPFWPREAFPFPLWPREVK